MSAGLATCSSCGKSEFLLFEVACAGGQESLTRFHSAVVTTSDPRPVLH